MNKPPLSLPWALKRGIDAGEEVLQAIAAAVQEGDDPVFFRAGRSAILDWRAIRVFYRIALDADGKDPRMEWGYFVYVPSGVAEQVVGHWNLIDAYRLKEDLSPSAWGPGWLQASLGEVLKHVTNGLTGARLINGIVAQSDVPVTHGLPSFSALQPPRL